MSGLRVIGVDPGPIPGFVVLDLENGRLAEAFAYQCTANAATGLLTWLLVDAPGPALVQVEKYVVGRQAGRVAHAGASATTRDLVGQLQQVVERHRPLDVRLAKRTAAQVKPWAEANQMERLAKAGLLEPTKGMRHARDAAKHALYAAVHDGGLPDPLSARWAS